MGESLKVAAENAGALQARVLKTSGALQETLPRMKSPMHTVWMNASSQPLHPGCKPEEIVALLKKQLTNPVLWEQSMKKVINDAAITEFYEVGPMKQLKAMMKRVDMKVWKTTSNV